MRTHLAARGVPNARDKEPHLLGDILLGHLGSFDNELVCMSVETLDTFEQIHGRSCRGLQQHKCGRLCQTK